MREESFEDEDQAPFEDYASDFAGDPEDDVEESVLELEELMWRACTSRLTPPSLATVDGFARAPVPVSAMSLRHTVSFFCRGGLGLSSDSQQYVQEGHPTV
jgi:hypothetical protein